MIARSLIERIFSAESIERWNDHPRPMRFSEMAKQAHKMVIAWLVARMEEETTGSAVDWSGMVEGGVFEFLHRVVLTDIKAPVFHRMMESHGEQLNKWVQSELADDLAPLAGDFALRFDAYFRGDLVGPRERNILRAAHYLASRWEFGLIRAWSAPLYGVDETGAEIDAQIERHRGLAAVDRILVASAKGDKNDLPAFIDLVGQLRFQKRWTQTPRIPETSVLGHLFLVAVLSWLALREVGADNATLVGTFFTGLFHDLPEVLTRDIISPVKHGVEGLEEFVKEYERAVMKERIYDRIRLPIACVDDLCFFTENEFADRVRLPGGGVMVRFDVKNAPLLPEGAEPVAGRMVKAFDRFAAFIEASLSIRYGVSTPVLQNARERLYEAEAHTEAWGYKMGSLFDYFW